MTRIVQEKFQIRPANQPDGDSNWVSDKSARTNKGLTATPSKLNRLPPGTNIDAQRTREVNSMPFEMGGQNDVSKDYNAQSVAKGYSRKHLLNTDDEYTNEHMDTFYGEVKVEGEAGFVERGNLLDRM